MDPLSRKRNVSDGDSGFDSALSSRSSSISLEESPEYGKLFDQEEEIESKFYFPCLKEKFASILTADEDISNHDDDEFDNVFIITNKVTGNETFYKPPSRLKFSCAPPTGRSHLLYGGVRPQQPDTSLTALPLQTGV